MSTPTPFIAYHQYKAIATAILDTVNLPVVHDAGNSELPTITIEQLALILLETKLNLACDDLLILTCNLPIETINSLTAGDWNDFVPDSWYEIDTSSGVYFDINVTTDGQLPHWYRVNIYPVVDGNTLTNNSLSFSWMVEGIHVDDVSIKDVGYVNMNLLA